MILYDPTIHGLPHRALAGATIIAAWFQGISKRYSSIWWICDTLTKYKFVREFAAFHTVSTQAGPGLLINLEVLSVDKWKVYLIKSLQNELVLLDLKNKLHFWWWYENGKWWYIK